MFICAWLIIMRMRLLFRLEGSSASMAMQWSILEARRCYAGSYEFDSGRIRAYHYYQEGSLICSKTCPDYAGGQMAKILKSACAEDKILLVLTVERVSCMIL